MSRHQRFSRMAVALGAVFVFCLSLLYLADSGSGTAPETSHTTFFLLSQARQTDRSAPTSASPALTPVARIPSAAFAVPSGESEALLGIAPGVDGVPHAIARPMESIPLPLDPELPPESEDRIEETGREAAADVSPPEGAAPEGRSYREVRALVTAYCPCSRCCGRHANGRTSLGTTAWRPGMAADPRAVPYGTLVDVPGYGAYAIDDTGGAMRQSWRRRGVIHIDIRKTYHWQAREWGRRYMTVRIYDPE